MTRRIAAAITVVAVVVILAWIALNAWQSSRTNAAKARLSTNQAKAGSDNAKDAIDATGMVSARQQASDDLTRNNAEQISDAKGSDAAVSPEARAAGLAALCRRPAYKDDPKCAK